MEGTSGICVPIHYVHSGIYQLSGPAAIMVEEKAREKGLVLDEMVVVCQELGDGGLAIGVFSKGETNPNSDNVLVGLVIPWGFWRTTDGRVTEGGMTTLGPGPDYVVPADQPNIALVRPCSKGNR